MPNQQVINGLNTAPKVTDIYAYLQDSGGRSLFTFLYNPEDKRFSRQSNYNAGVTALSSIPSQQYQHTSGLTLQLSNLLMQSYAEGKTIKLLLQRLQNLMVVDPTNNKFNPTPVYFTWGTDKFGPAVITSLDWSETSWLNGEVAEARVNLTLLEIPSGKPSTNQSQNQLEVASNKNQVLTVRQKQDASKKAIEWLRANTKRLSSTTAALINANRFKLLTEDSGVVNLTDSKSKKLGVIGIYQNGKFITTKNTLIKGN